MLEGVEGVDEGSESSEGVHGRKGEVENLKVRVGSKKRIMGESRFEAGWSAFSRKFGKRGRRGVEEVTLLGLIDRKKRGSGLENLQGYISIVEKIEEEA